MRVFGPQNTSNMTPPPKWVLHQSSKHQVKTIARSAVLQFWLTKLCHQAEHLSSLKYLQNNLQGLTTCHPMLRLCGSSSREVEKACCQAPLLTGHWTLCNKEGMCALPDCWRTPPGPHAHKGTVESLLISDPATHFLPPEWLY